VQEGSAVYLVLTALEKLLEAGNDVRGWMCKKNKGEEPVFGRNVAIMTKWVGKM